MNEPLPNLSHIAPELLPSAVGIARLKSDDIVETALEFVRAHLGMEAAYLSEFVGDELVVRAVSASGLEGVLHVDATFPLEQAYCRHILSGELPELIPDTAQEALCDSIAATHEIPIKSHVSVPIRRPDGTAYGMFCCLSRTVRHDLTQRDLEVMRAFADLSAEQVNGKIAARLAHDCTHDMIDAVLHGRDFDIAYQPIMDAAARRPRGFEALCRFRANPYRAPNLWFDDAATVGLQTELEICVIEKALEALDVLPASVYLSVNASPATVTSGRLEAVFSRWPTERIVLEMTEHAMVDDYDALLAELELLRFRGIRLAIDDAGAGYSGLQHIVRLRPDIIKLDISLTSRIDKDIVRRSLAGAMLRFAIETNAAIIAEGVETAAELSTLYDLGVPLAQGYFLGRPEDLSRARAWFNAEPGASGAAG